MAELNEKILNTRIQLKYDSLNNWNNSTVVLKAGELAIVSLGEVVDGSSAKANHPVLFKVGTGEHTFAQLPFASALAADVYAWAKKENPDWNDFSEIPGLKLGIELEDNDTGNFITGITYDATTKKFVINRSDITIGGLAVKDEVNFITTEWQVDGDPDDESYATHAKVPVHIKKVTITEYIDTDPEVPGEEEIVERDYLKLTADISGAGLATEDLVQNSQLSEVVTSGTGQFNPEYEGPQHDYAMVQFKDGNGDELAYLQFGTDDTYIKISAQAEEGNIEDNTKRALHINTTEALDNAINAAQTNAEATAAAALSKAREEITKEIADALPTEIGVMSVTGKDAIAVTTGANPEVSLTLDPTSGNVVLTQSTTGLKANIDLSAYRLIADDEDTKYGLTYDENTKQIKLVENGGADHIDASDFVIDGMLESVVADQNANTLTFTWNTDGGETVTTIHLSDIADIYTGSTSTTVQVGVSNTNVISAEVVAGSLTDAHIATNAGIAETKLAEGVQTALGLARTALQSHQDITGKADKVTSATAGNFASLDANGNLVDSGNKASDFALANIDTGVHSVTLGSGTNNGTLKLTVDGTETDNIAVTGLGSAAYTSADSYKTKQEAYSEEGSTAKTITKVEQNANGEVTVTYGDIAFPELPVVNNGKLSITTEDGVLTGSGEFTANQAGNTSIAIAIADKGISTAKIADQAVGAEQTKAYQTSTPTKDNVGSEEVWVFYCGTSEILV